jgi:hypothetical protein
MAGVKANGHMKPVFCICRYGYSVVNGAATGVSDPAASFDATSITSESKTRFMEEVYRRSADSRRRKQEQFRIT